MPDHRRWTIDDGRWTTAAQVLSILAHPFVLVAVMVAAVATRNTVGNVGRTVMVVMAFTVVPLAILMVRQVRAGAWDNADASNIGERPVLFLVGGLGLIALLGYLVVSHSQSFLIRGAAGTLGMMGACAIATRWIKVSLHMAFATFCATVLLLIGSPVAWVVAAIVPALGWSRLVLARHSSLEIGLGALIGIASGLVLVLM